VTRCAIGSVTAALSNLWTSFRRGIGCTTSSMVGGDCDDAGAANSVIRGQRSTPASTARTILSARPGVIARSVQEVMMFRPQETMLTVAMHFPRAPRLPHLCEKPFASTFRRAFRCKMSSRDYRWPMGGKTSARELVTGPRNWVVSPATRPMPERNPRKPTR
jgi:hypothetical protein